jgi:antitoxin component YwqK of YwqJK toxin-antitoxin module
MINESVFAELLFQQIQDPKTWCRLSQVSKRFNKVIKSKLIKKENIDEDGRITIWTELPNGQRHGLLRKWYKVSDQTSGSHGLLEFESHYIQGILQSGKSWYPNGLQHYERNYQQGKLHGLWRKWYFVSVQSSEARGQLEYEHNYQQGQFHGLYQGWYSDGQLMYESNYQQGKLIEK